MIPSSITKAFSVRLFAVAAGITSTFFVTTSLAVFSDLDTNSANSFEVGTLALDLGSTSALFNVTGMLPGDSAFAALQLTNNGTIGLQYTMSSSATNTDNKNLAAALTAEVREISGSTCNASTFATAGIWAPNVTGLASLTSSTAATLSVNQSRRLCFRVSLPSSAANSLQGSTTSASFTFASTQV